MGHSMRFLCVHCLVMCAISLRLLALLLKQVAVVLSLLFIVLCIGAVSHLAYGTAIGRECAIGLLLFAAVAAIFHLLAFAMRRAARGFEYSVPGGLAPRGFEVRLVAPRPVLPAEQPPS